MQWERPQRLFARQLLTDKGWERDALVTLDAAGFIASIEAGATPPVGVLAFDLVLPGMANVHSHAFQRAMAGLAEAASGEGYDNFWSWRKVMYAFTRELSPEQVEAIARALYIEMLKNGYTAVGEFHYLHHGADGKPYSSITELSDRIIAAAGDSGIALTHLPVMYESGNFGGAPAGEGQKRFIHTAQGYLKLVEALAPRCRREDIVLGIAPHSLRAVTPQSLHMITDALPGMGLGGCPVHIHIAEQEKEVADCTKWSGQRPVEWLFSHAQVDANWCLIHATHSTKEEISAIAASGAVAGLCPTTEANLGDGIFPTPGYLQAGWKFGIGTDSNVCVSPWEELRQMEYAQRLLAQRRAVLGDEATQSVGRNLFTRAAGGGAQALGIPAGVIAKGFRADLIALSMDDPLLALKEGDQILDTLVFGGIRPAITDVLVAGKHVIVKGAHRLEERSRRDLQQAMQVLAGKI